MICQFPNSECLARGNPHGSGVNPGRRLLDMPRKAQINHPAVGNPIVRSYPDGNEKKKNCRPKQSQAKPGCPKALADPNTQGGSPFRRKKKTWVALNPLSI